MMPEIKWLGEHAGFGRFEVKCYKYEDGKQRLSIWDWKTNKLVYEQDFDGQGQTENKAEAQANG